MYHFGCKRQLFGVITEYVEFRWTKETSYQSKILVVASLRAVHLGRFIYCSVDLTICKLFIGSVAAACYKA